MIIFVLRFINNSFKSSAGLIKIAPEYGVMVLDGVILKSTVIRVPLICEKQRIRIIGCHNITSV